MDLAEISEFTEEQARAFLEKVRWPNGPICPHCKSADTVRINGKAERVRDGLLRCKTCRKQFTVTAGTIFEKTRVPLRKWLIAYHLMCSSKKGVSALQLKRNLSIAYQTAWHMGHRIRLAMKTEPMKKLLKKTVEVDETYVGGKSRLGIRGRGSERKTPVMALVERNGSVRTRVIERVNAETLKGAIRQLVNKGATIMTDEWAAYKGIGKEFKGGHKVVNHRRKEYVRGDAYTNTAESYFALLKRGLHGIFHQVSKKHLQRYCDEFEFRWNNRKIKDGERTVEALKGAEGKRLTYKQPTQALA